MSIARWARTLVVPVAVLVTSGSSVAPRCSCGTATFLGVQPAEDVTLLPGSDGLRVVSTTDPRDIPLQLLRIREAGSDVDLELTWTQAVRGESTRNWFVRPSDGFEAGQTYTVTSWRAYQGRSSSTRRDREAAVLRVTISDAPRPALDGLALEIGVPVIQNVPVPSGGGMCAEAVRSVARRIAVRFPDGLAEYRSSFHYETLIDGEPWYVRASLCDVPVSGTTRYSSGTDVVFAPCSQSSLLSTGTHSVAMRVRDLRTDEVAVTPEVPLELVCSDTHPTVERAVNGVSWRQHWGEVRAIEAIGMSQAIVGSRGAGIASIGTGATSRTSFEDGLASDEVIDLMYDREGRLWAVGIGGWAVYEDGRWSRDTEVGGLNPGLVFGVSQDADGGIWFSTDVGAARLHEGQWELWTEDEGLPGPVVHATLTDRDGTRWFACRDGIARAAEGADRAEVVFGDVNGRAVLEAPDGSVWFGTSDGALRFADGAWERSLEGVAVYPRLVDEFGDIWAGSAEDGVFRHSAAGWSSIPLPAEFRGSEVFDVSRAGGMVWLGTSRGAARLQWPAPPESFDSVGVASAFLAQALPTADAALALLPSTRDEFSSFCLSFWSLAWGPARADEAGRPFPHDVIEAMVEDRIAETTGLRRADQCRIRDGMTIEDDRGERAVEFGLALEFLGADQTMVSLGVRSGRTVITNGVNCTLTRAPDGTWAPARACRRATGSPER